MLVNWQFCLNTEHEFLSFYEKRFQNVVVQLWNSEDINSDKEALQ